MTAGPNVNGVRSFDMQSGWAVVVAVAVAVAVACGGGAALAVNDARPGLAKAASQMEKGRLEGLRLGLPGSLCAGGFP